MGAHRHPGPRRVRRCSTPAIAAGLADGRPRLRAAPVRPAAPGGLPDPARQPDRRAARRIDGTDRSRRARATPVTLPIPSGATGVTVTGPTARSPSSSATGASGSAVTFASTQLPGIYTVTPILAPPRPPHLGAAGTTAASRRRRPVASASAGSSPSPPSTRHAPVRFAVDLFDVDESTIAPGAGAPSRRSGRGPSRLTGTRPGSSHGTPDHPGRAVGADRADRAHRALLGMGRLPP